MGTESYRKILGAEPGARAPVSTEMQVPIAIPVWAPSVNWFGDSRGTLIPPKSTERSLRITLPLSELEQLGARGSKSRASASYLAHPLARPHPSPLCSPHHRGMLRTGER